MLFAVAMGQIINDNNYDKTSQVIITQNL